jgi:ferredoxin-NADP reductase
VIQKLACLVERVVAHGERVYTLVLKPERPAPRFRPGQFLHLALDRYDPTGFWPESRVFSIASGPAERERLSLTYAVHGRFTERMEAEALEGRRVWIKLPYGDFVIDASADVALFAGGTGVTAFTAFLEVLPPESPHHVLVAYGARRDGLLIYRDALERCAARARAIELMYFVERPEGGIPSTHAGRVSVETVWPRVRDPRRTQFYISGPPPMLKGIARDLTDRGVDPGAIHIDAWE